MKVERRSVLILKDSSSWRLTSRCIRDLRCTGLRLYSLVSVEMVYAQTINLQSVKCQNILVRLSELSCALWFIAVFPFILTGIISLRLQLGLQVNHWHIWHLWAGHWVSLPSVLQNLKILTLSTLSIAPSYIKFVNEDRPPNNVTNSNRPHLVWIGSYAFYMEVVGS